MHNLVDKFFKSLQNHQPTPGEVIYEGVRVFYKQPQPLDYHVPDFQIGNVDELEKALQEYMKAIHELKIGFTNPIGIHEDFDDFFLNNLVRDMTNADYENFPEYIRRRIDFLKDRTFFNLKTETELSKIGDYSISVQMKEELHGLETPFSLDFKIRKHSKPYHLPKVRYGIFSRESKKVACIYAIQDSYYDGKPVKFKEDINKQINGVNSGQKEYRNCSPRALLSLSLFLKLLHDKGIREIIVPDFIPVRFAFRYDNNQKRIPNEEKLLEIQERITSSICRLFQRAENQISGIDITAFPNDVDSFMHIKMGETLSTNNKLLATICDFNQAHSITSDDKNQR